MLHIRRFTLLKRSLYMKEGNRCIVIVVNLQMSEVLIFPLYGHAGMQVKGYVKGFTLRPLKSIVMPCVFVEP